MLGLGPSLALCLAVAAPTPDAGATSAKKRFRVDRPNIVTAGAVFELPNPGVAIAYERLLHRAFGLRVDLEHLVSPVGFRHLPGLSSSLAVTAYPLQSGAGPFLLAGGGIGTNFWARRPGLARTTGFVDFAGGYRFVFERGFTLGASVGVRAGFNGNKEDRLCTHRDVCRNARTGAFARLLVEVGWRFGRRLDSG